MARSSAMKNFIENVERIRRERGITQAELAVLVGTKQPTVSKVLRGEEEISLFRADKWAAALGVELSELVANLEFVK